MQTHVVASQSQSHASSMRRDCTNHMPARCFRLTIARGELAGHVRVTGTVHHRGVSGSGVISYLAWLS
jgi:hypothetical protein